MFNQSSRVLLPKMPALGYWGAWIWVSVLAGVVNKLSGRWDEMRRVKYL